MIFSTLSAILKYIGDLLFVDTAKIELDKLQSEVQRLRKQNEWLKKSMETMIETNNRTLQRSASMPVSHSEDCKDPNMSWYMWG